MVCILNFAAGSEDYQRSERISPEFVNGYRLEYTFFVILFVGFNVKIRESTRKSAIDEEQIRGISIPHISERRIYWFLQNLSVKVYLKMEPLAKGIPFPCNFNVILSCWLLVDCYIVPTKRSQTSQRTFSSGVYYGFYVMRSAF